MGNQDREFRQLKILSLDGSEIYKKMHPLSGEAMLKVKKDNDKIDANKLKGYLDESLDTVYLERIYSKYKENLLTKKFRFSGNRTLALVNVSFDYAIKEFSKKGNTFVRNGYEEQVEWDKFEDHLFVIEENGQPLLIAIEIPKESKRGDSKYAPVEVPRLELLGDYFIYDEKKRIYGVAKGKRDETKIPTAIKKDDIRKDLYKNGFVIDGVKYVRYKRSAGSSRDGQCLFIAEPLYEPMMTWSSCGLDGNSVDDQASWQAYISLTLSSIEDRIYIPKKAILIIRDQESVFDENAVNVSADGESLCAKLEKVQIENKIWDGEALLDVSVFEVNGYGDNGMLLLRNRFFKTCAFNTNLQQWFRDKGIRDLSQLSGHYYKDAPRRIEDIKLVITESSLKYLKFFDKDKWETGFDQWIENIFDEADNKESKLFGVVKFDHETGPMENQMVNTNYQLLNTLGLTYEDVGALLDQSEIFYKKMQEDPMYLRRYINLYVLAKDEDDPFGKNRLKADSYRQHLLNTMMRLTDNFEFTEFYKSFRKDMCQSFKEHLKFGRIYTEGNYQTILGNGMEFLCAIIDDEYKVDVPLALSDGEVYTERFPDGEKLLCARSPHITMGNLLVATNVHDEQLKKYFNLGKAQAIVCVNAIHSNIQQRLKVYETGDDGQIKEWYHEKKLGDFGEFHHRHMSHLLGLFPCNVMNKFETPELINAAVISMNHRTDKSTGWSMGQKINTWARVGDGDRVLKIIGDLFKNGIYPNFFDYHPPFQIDGNFGFTSGVNEMLMQSNCGLIELLPALPSEWDKGSISGIVARGNFIIGMEWENNTLKTAKITSASGGKCTVFYNKSEFAVEGISSCNKKLSFETERGKTYLLTI